MPPLLAPFFGAALTALAGFGVAALNRLAKYLGTREAAISNEALRDMIGTVSNFVFGKVAELTTAAVDKLKAAAPDGKLTAAQAQAALRTAVEEVWSSLPASFKDLLLKHYGSVDQVKTQLIEPQVESAVNSQKRSATSFGGTYTLSSAGSIEHPQALRPSPREIQQANARIGLQN